MSLTLLLNGNGSDASTTITDSGPFAHAVTANGNAQLDTAQQKFGSASMLFDGTGDYLTIPDHASLSLTSGDFTLGCFVRFNSTSGGFKTLAAKRTGSTGARQWELVYGGGQFFFACTGTIEEVVSVVAYQTVTTGVWYYIEVNRDGDTLSISVDGLVGGEEEDPEGSYDMAEGETFIASSASVSIGAYNNGSGSLNGWIDGFFIDKGVAYHSEAPPTEEMGADESIEGTISLPPILGAPAIVARHDFTSAVADLSTTYVMDLLDDEGARVRVPISSWQSTQQTVNACYLACVVPACAPWAEAIEAATHFAISRCATIADGRVIESEMARAPLETIQFDEGPTNYTASLSGYSDPIEADEDPPATTDRELQGVRSVSVYATGLRIRCAIDWLLRPSQRALFGETSFLVSYINYYASANTASVDEYMDVGERIEA